MMRVLRQALAASWMIALFLLPVAAHAKKVVIDWGEMEGAVAYELLILRADGKPLSKKPRKIEEPGWSGDLKFGVYAYQIRAIDKRNRPGMWSEPQALAVMPEAPALIDPQDGSKFDFYHPKATMTLSWEPVPGVSEYRLQLERDSKPHIEQVVSENKADLGLLPQGSYSWKVHAVLKLPKRAPASLTGLEGRSWNSEPSDTYDFQLNRHELSSPEIVGPIGMLPPSPNGEVLFHWKKVEGAQYYEVRFIRATASRSSDEIAAAFQKARPLIAKTESVPLRVPVGNYVWQVRALASLPNGNDSTHAGPEAQSSIEINPNAVFARGAGYIALSTMLAPYTYKIVSPLMGYGGDVSSTSMTVRASGEYWPWSQWGLGAAGEITTFALNSRNFKRSSFELTAKYQANVSRDRFGWYLAPKAGLEARQYVVIGPDFSGEPNVPVGVKSNSILATGVSGGFDIRKQFSERWSLGGKVSYFVPLALSGAEGAKITGQASYRNLSLGLQGLYWVTRDLGLSVGAFSEKRSLSYQPSSTSEPERVLMDGTYFFGSVLYRFGGS